MRRSWVGGDGRSDGAQAVLELGSFSWRTDLPQPLGGSGAAPSPTALLLSALAGCAVVFIRDTLAPQLGVRVGVLLLLLTALLWHRA